MSEDFVFAPIAASGGCVDVIFIHGLTGDPISTWTSSESGEPEGGFWPKWIAKDVPGLNIYTLGYPASVFGRWARKEMALHEQAIATLEQLAGYDIGKRPIGLIVHSLGGLLAKQLIRFGSEAADRDWKAIAKNCKLVVFLATPHTGATLASILTFIVPELISDHVELLRSGSNQLDDLNQAYRNIAQEHKIKTVSYYEKYKAKHLRFVVDKQDADPGVGNIIPAQADHLNICKPSNRQQPIYRTVYRELKKLVTAAQPSNIPISQKIERDVDITQQLQKEFVQGWLTSQLPHNSGADIKEKFEAGVFDLLSKARRKALSGKWEGQEKQSSGPGGEPIEYPVFLDISWQGNLATGEHRFVWSMDGTIIVDETLPFEGGFYDRFLLLNYQDTVTGKIQFGSLFLELSDDGVTLQGVDVGVGYKTKKIMSNDIILHKKS